MSAEDNNNKMGSASGPSVKNVIMDVDVGTDDAWAIFLMLNAERKGLVKIRAITCIHGNSDVTNIGKNVLRLLTAANRLDIPVYLGCNEPLVVHSPLHDDKEQLFHGRDGLCDLPHDFEPDTSIIRKEHAVNAIQKIISTESNINIMCLGPLTNLAILLKLYPVESKRIQSVWLMGGNRHGVGNITSAAEYNFYCDPEAAFAVFQSATCPIYMLPLETVRIMRIPLEFRLLELANHRNSITQFLDPIERKAFRNHTEWVPYDAIVAACFIDERLIEKLEHWHVTIELGGFFSRGQVILDHNDCQKSGKNVHIIELVNVAAFRAMVLDTVRNANK